jgi:hypothetical protein
LRFADYLDRRAGELESAPTAACGGKAVPPRRGAAGSCD